MSYGFNMFFKQVSSKEEAHNLAVKTADLLYENMVEFIKNNKFYIPSIKYSVFHPEQAKETKRYLEEIDKYWLCKLFSSNFVYWEKEKLLGFLGENYPKPVEELYDVEVYFQNSCDQDYNYKDWGNKINIFNKIIAEIKNITDAEELAKINFSYGYNETYIKEIEEDIEYYQKSGVYTQIFETLHLEEWLWDNEDDYFERFSIQSLNSMEKHTEVNLFLKEFLNVVLMNDKLEILVEEIEENKKKINELYNKIISCQNSNDTSNLDNYKSELRKWYSNYQNNVKEYNSLIPRYNGKITEKLDFFEKGRKKEITTEEIDKKVKEVL